ncbi:MAG: HAD family phosphatase [Acutalibacteraceae bacterium]|nr:HAD family phosphatase [Acutalibacteraceae bacterium]
MFSVIFDMDGTLLDSQRIYIPAWEYAGKLQGIEGMGAHALNNFGTNDEGSKKYLEENFPQLDVPLFKKQYDEYAIENGTVSLKKGVMETLNFLESNGIKIGLASGTKKSLATTRLEKVNILEFFDVVVFGDEVKNGKPAPDIFLKTASLIGAKPEECIVFEDSPNGIKAANKAGMKCIGIPDIVEFDSKIKSILFAEYTSMDKAIELLKEMIK